MVNFYRVCNYYYLDTVFGLCKQLTAYGKTARNMRDARKNAVCIFPGITHISVEIKMLSNIYIYIAKYTPHRIVITYGEEK